MKNLNWFNKTMYFFNIVLSFFTILGYLLPFLAPKLFPFLSVLTLFLPVLLVLNFGFIVYWFIQFKRQILLSIFVLLLGITFVSKFYKLNNEPIDREKSDLKIMSYNVRLFNLYKWIDRENVSEKISEFIKNENPDVICFQEFSNNNEIDFSKYPYNYKNITGKNTKLGQAIYSKHKIINKGIIEVKNTNNQTLFVDILIKNDTIRLYNIHLESIKITPDVHEIDENVNSISEEKSKRILKRISKSFKIQQEQAEKIKIHELSSPFSTILCGDLNNSAYSFAYRLIVGNHNDAFIENGKGLGYTYNFKYYPARIDFIFVENNFIVKDFKTHNNFFHSDHFPITSVIDLKLNSN
jgi:endonuclease/exonuclease/phosphatase family metal-dependent hydrolase